MTHFWPDGQRIEVVMDGLWAPLSFTWNGHPHAVQVLIDRWRVDEDWWRGRVWREYFRLTTRSGLLLELFHDLRTDAWYVQRVYD